MFVYVRAHACVCMCVCLLACMRACVCVTRAGSEVKWAQFLPFVTTFNEHISKSVPQLK